MTSGTPKTDPGCGDAAGVCPVCGARDVARILYGRPSLEVNDALARGEVVMGGCMFTPDAARWRCKACGKEWGRMGDANV